MNLFWETRNLTQAREDHLTCFIAAALEADVSFRHAYESRVLGSLAGDSTPQIREVRIQVVFDEQRSRPDMMLMLKDGRQVVCEHKLDSPETLQLGSDDEVVTQLERYLNLPGVDAVTYFRPLLSPPSDAVLSHAHYLHPASAPHFLWRDLYEPLESGQHDVTRWLREGFEKLGFTPPHPHIGELWPDDQEDVKINQANFGKLWDVTRSHLEGIYSITTGRRCELYLVPQREGPIIRAYVSPLAQGGSILRIRVEPNAAEFSAVRDRLDFTASSLPAPPDIVSGSLPNRHPYIDLITPLRTVLGKSNDALQCQIRLSAQVVPALTSIFTDARSDQWKANTPLSAPEGRQ
jgi:hypothetical protein